MNSNIPSSRSPTDPEVQQTTVRSHARPTSGQDPTLDFSGKMRSRMGPASMMPHSRSLSTVEEKDTTTAEDTLSKDSQEKGDPELGLSASSQNQGSVTNCHGKRDPFANENGNGIQYKTMAWWQASMLMVAETISLGVLSLPASLSVLGMIPGLILIVFLGILAYYTGCVIGQFKIRYPHVQNMADAGEILFGGVGREVFGFGQLFFIVFIMAAHILSFSIMMNAITSHGTCTVVFMVVGTVISLIFTMPRTLGNLSYYCIASFASIIGAVLITMIGVSITKPGRNPISHKQDFSLFPPAGVTFHEGFLAMTNIVFAYAGHVAFFGFISELRQPKEFPKALALLQCSDISMYIVTSVVIYYYAGTNVGSPALDSASPIVRKVAYGVAIPTIVIAGVVNGHVAVKYLYVRLFRNNQDDIMHQKTFKAYGLWLLICFVLWVVAWLIAEAIPVFHDLLGITGALFASWFTYGCMGFMWIQMNMKRVGWTVSPTDGWTRRKAALLVLNCGCILVGATICFVGLYASAKNIALDTRQTKPFSCADNSQAKF